MSYIDAETLIYLLLKSYNTRSSKKLASNSAILMLRTLITMGISFYTSRLVLQCLGVTDFGVYGVVCGVTSLISMITSSLSEAVNRFLTVEIASGDENRINHEFAVCNTILFAVSVLYLLISESIGLWIFFNLNIPSETFSSAFWLYQVSILSSIVTINSIPYTSLIVAYEKFNVFGVLSIVEAALKLGLVFLLFFAPNHSRLFLYGLGLLSVSVIIRIFNALYILSIANFIKYRFSRDYSRLLNLFGFTGNKLLWEFAYSCTTHGINILINLFFGPIINAARSIAYQVQNIAYRLLVDMQTPLRQEIIKKYELQDNQYINNLVFSGIKISFYCMTVALVPVIIGTEYLLGIWLGEYPPETVIIVQLLCVETLIFTSFRPFEFVIDASGDIKKYKLWQSGIFLLVLPFSFLAYKFNFSFYYPFLFLIVAQFLILIVRLYIIGPKVNIIKSHFAMLIVKLVSCFVSDFIILNEFSKCFENSFLSLLLMSICSVIFTSIFMYFVCCNNIEKNYINKIIKSFF